MNEHKEMLLNNCIAYLAELKERNSEEEKQYFWTKIIGMTEEEMNYYEV